jgi:hypothetical protein
MMHRTIETETDAAEGAPSRGPLAKAGAPRLLGRVVAAAGLIGVLSLLALEGTPPGQVARAVPEPVTTGAFVPSSAVVRPAIPLAASAPRYRIDDAQAFEPVRLGPSRLDPTTGLREDVLIQGAFDAIEAPFMRLTVTHGLAAEAAPKLFLTLVRRAADGHGLAVARTGQRGRLETKFGPVETLEATLAGEGHRICTAFAGIGTAPIRIDGWLCAPLGQPPEPRAVACTLDKLVPNGQAEPFVEVAFKTYETRRDPLCRDTSAPPVGAGEGALRRTRKIEAQLRQSAQARP